jgi:glycosyltransferase involved in cell wall biosynthesis
MKPFLLVSGDFVKSGGMDRCNYALAEYLAARGDETHLVGFRIGRELDECPTIRFHRVRKPLNSYFLGRPLLASRGRTEAKRIARAGGRVVVNGGNCAWPDVNWIIHLHSRYKPAIAGSIPRRMKAELEFRQAAHAEREALACARLVITCAEATRQELVGDFKIPADKIHRVDPGVEHELFRIPTPAERSEARANIKLEDETHAVAFVGAVGDRRKGFDIVYAAWKELCHDPNWIGRLIVIGTGSELTDWRRRAEDDGIASRIQFLGFNPRPEFVAKVLQACDVLVAPTRYEGYGLAIQEAVCVGLPVIASRLAPVTDRFEGGLSDLMLHDPNNVKDLVHRLRIWASRRPEFTSEASILSTKLRKWTWNDMAARITEIIEADSQVLEAERG